MKLPRPPLLALLIFITGCTPQGSTEKKDQYEKSQANITHEDGWSIVSKTENGDPVYWFIAPEENGVSPAMYKKIINTRDSSQPAVKIVSECEAPKQLCEELGKKFREISEKYK